MGKKIPNPRYAVVSMRVDYEQADALKAYAAYNNISCSDVMRDLCKVALTFKSSACTAERNQ